LQVQVSPASVSQGQQFTVTATVLAKDGITPLAGASCAISAASGPSLFTSWPTAIVSNTQGIAAWTLQAPAVAPGRYEMRVQGNGSRGYYVYVDASIVIAAA
jgi:hypothetical protein